MLTTAPRGEEPKRAKVLCHGNSLQRNGAENGGTDIDRAGNKSPLLPSHCGPGDADPGQQPGNMEGRSGLGVGVSSCPPPSFGWAKTRKGDRTHTA